MQMNMKTQGLWKSIVERKTLSRWSLSFTQYADQQIMSTLSSSICFALQRFEMCTLPWWYINAQPGTAWWLGIGLLRMCALHFPVLTKNTRNNANTQILSQNPVNSLTPLPPLLICSYPTNFSPAAPPHLTPSYLMTLGMLLCLWCCTDFLLPFWPLTCI